MWCVRVCVCVLCMLRAVLRYICSKKYEEINKYGNKTG